MKVILEGKTALLTGASAGIGVALAHQLAPKVKRLILVARRKAELEKVAAGLKGCEAIVEPCDLGKPTEVQALADRLLKKYGAIDVLINNAGLGKHAWFHELSPEDIDNMVQVNVLAVLQLTRALIPKMIEQKSGAILNIGSGAGLIPLVKSITYAGTKHFINGWSTGLRAELAPHRISVTQLMPGPVESEFHQRAGIDIDGPARPPKAIRITSEQCAAEAISGFERGEAVIFPGALYRLSMRLLATLPKAMVRSKMVRDAHTLAKS
jgi:short-subunit dehydrogenase